MVSINSLIQMLRNGNKKPRKVKTILKWKDDMRVIRNMFRMATDTKVRSFVEILIILTAKKLISKVES